MPPLIAPEDLAPWGQIEQSKAEAMIADATAMALRIAPCLRDTEDPDKIAAAKAVLRQAILRWNEAGSGAVQSKTIGPFGETFDTRQPRRGLFWPTEISDLEGLCSNTRKAFVIDPTDPVPSNTMADRPDLWFQWLQPVPPDAP